MTPLLDKRRMRTAFSRQAAVYERYSHLQRQIGDELLRVIAAGIDRTPAFVLDIGCGTGYLMGRCLDLFPGAAAVGIDISPGMLAHCRERETNSRSLVLADAESIPFAAERFDLAVSSSTYQWVEPLRKAFREVVGVVKPNGLFAAAVFSRGTLRELRDCYSRASRSLYPGRTIDLHPFPDRDMVQTALDGSGFELSESSSREYRLDFANLEGLFRYLKGLGAQNAVRSEPGGLGKRRLLRRTARLYRAEYGLEQGLPAAFSVEYFLARKKPGP